MAIALLFFLTVSTVGKQFKSSKGYFQRTKSFRFFGIIYPNHQIYFGILILWVILLINRAGVWRGSAMALVDKSPYANLPSITIYSSKSLPLQGRLDLSTNLYVYDHLRLIDGNDDYLFLLDEPGNIPPATLSTYAIPRTSELILELKP